MYLIVCYNKIWVENLHETTLFYYKIYIIETYCSFCKFYYTIKNKPSHNKRKRLKIILLNKLGNTTCY